MPSTRASSRAPVDAAVAVASAAAVTTCNPRTASGKKASAAALEREHEYVDWLAGLPEPARDDEPRDDSWAAFMKERRRCKEKERLRNIEDQRTAKRRQQQTDPAFVQRQSEFAEWLQARPSSSSADAGAPFIVFQRERREKRQRERTVEHCDVEFASGSAGVQEDDEQLPPGVYRDENGDLYDEDA